MASPFSSLKDGARLVALSAADAWRLSLGAARCNLPNLDFLPEFATAAAADEPSDRATKESLLMANLDKLFARAALVLPSPRIVCEVAEGRFDSPANPPFAVAVFAPAIALEADSGILDDALFTASPFIAAAVDRVEYKYQPPPIVNRKPAAITPSLSQLPDFAGVLAISEVCVSTLSEDPKFGTGPSAEIVSTPSGVPGSVAWAIVTDCSDSGSSTAARDTAPSDNSPRLVSSSVLLAPC